MDRRVEHGRAVPDRLPDPPARLSAQHRDVVVVTSQVANALTLYLWGRLSDRLSNKAILAVALPVYFVCTLGLVFTDIRDHALLKLGLLYVLHVAMGAATGGIGLATGNLGLKLAPQGEGTAYLAVIGLVSALCGDVVGLTWQRPTVLFLLKVTLVTEATPSSFFSVEQSVSIPAAALLSGSEATIVSGPLKPGPKPSASRS